ncbi:hypothetical protein ACI78V_16580 [Geodermatophilus sp. SYSU D00742]
MAIDRAPLLRPSRVSDDLTLSGLLDVLERADELPLRDRPRPARAAALRPGRSRTARTPHALRPLPPARPVPVPRSRPPQAQFPAPAARPEPAAAAGRRPGLLARLRAVPRRLALWGSGPDGAYLAWGRPAVTRPPAVASPTGRWPVPAEARAGLGARLPRLGARLRAVPRRLALWGSGPDGAYLAWGRPPAPAPRADGPVVLTELPSTPTIQPAASSPAAALLPARAPRPVAPSRVPVVPPLARQVPAPRPTPSPGTARAGHGPRGARASGPARARGDPRPPPARGQPPG